MIFVSCYLLINIIIIGVSKINVLNKNNAMIINVKYTVIQRKGVQFHKTLYLHLINIQNV